MALPHEVDWLCARLALGMNYSTRGPDGWAEYVLKNQSAERSAQLLSALNDVVFGRYDMSEIDAAMRDHFEHIGLEFKGDVIDLFKQVKAAAV